MSRETRLLFITVLVAIVTLSVLARIRFPDRAATGNPVPPLLTGLADRAGFENLAVEVAGLESRLAPALIALESAQGVFPALRIRDDVGVALLATAPGAASAQPPADLAVLARDPASGLAIVQVQTAPPPALVLWFPQRPQYPRYLLVSDVSRQEASLRPVFVGSLYSAASPTWAESLWVAPARSDLAAGAFAFTMDGALAGLAVEHEGLPALLPAEAVIRLAERMLGEGIRGGGWLGVTAQALTAAVASVTGSSAGVVVTSVDPGSPAAGKFAVADVIETIGGEAVASLEHWQARQARLAPGDSLVLGVRRRGELQEIQLTVGDTPPTPSEARPLGLTMRAVPRVGVEIARVDPGSAAALAGIEPGDLVTLIGEVERPSPAQVTVAFQAAPDERPLLVGIARGNRHLVLALGKR